MSRSVLMVDANVCSLVFGDDAEFGPVREALFLGRPKPWTLAHGGKLTDELKAVNAAWSALIALDRAGSVIVVASPDVELEIARLVKQRVCRSNDIHVVAVGRLSKARLLCSRDQNLIADFTDSRLISRPRGRVYQNHTHARLLRG